MFLNSREILVILSWMVMVDKKLCHCISTGSIYTETQEEGAMQPLMLIGINHPLMLIGVKSQSPIRNLLHAEMITASHLFHLKS